MGKLKPLPKKREKGQPKIDGFLVKKKKRVTNNASKTPTAPRGPKPKKKKIIDVEADDDDVIFIDQKTGSQIDLTGESPEKEKPDPDFDMAKSEGDKVVQSEAMDLIEVDEPPMEGPGVYCKPQTDLGATDDEVSVEGSVEGFDLSNSEGNKVVEPEAMEVKPKPKFFMQVASMPTAQSQKKVVEFESGYPRGYYKVLGPGNTRFDIEVLFDPSVEAFNEHLLLIGRRIGRPFKVGIQIAEDGRGFMRNEDGGSYPECCYRKKDSLVAADGINTNEKFMALENCFKTCGWPTTNMNGSNGLIGSNTMGGRTFDGNTYGFVYVAPIIQDTLEKFYPVYRAFRVANAQPGQTFTEKGRLVNRNKGVPLSVPMGGLLNLLLNSNLAIDDVHEAFLHLGGKRLNDLCKSDPDLMKARGVSTNFIDPHGWSKLVAEYVKMFPDRKDTLGWIPNATPLEPGKSPIGYSKLFEMERPKLFVRAVDELVTRKYLVQIKQSNPKKWGKAPWKRYENYKKAKTVAEMKTLGAETGDIINDVKAGFVKLVKPP